MIRPKTCLVSFLLLAIMFPILVQAAEATAMYFTVHGGQEVTQSLSLAVNDHVSITFTIVGASIHFYMIYPNGSERDFGDVGDLNYSFVCNAGGEYVLHFSNVGSSDEFVTLNYEIDQYIFGIPQTLFLVIIIVIICVIAAAVFIIMGNPH